VMCLNIFLNFSCSNIVEPFQRNQLLKVTNLKYVGPRHCVIASSTGKHDVEVGCTLESTPLYREEQICCSGVL